MFPVLRPGILWTLRIHCDIGCRLRSVLFSKKLLWIPTLRRICSVFYCTNALTTTTTLMCLLRIAKKAVTLEIKDNAITTQIVQVMLSVVRQQQMAKREQKHLSVPSSHCIWNLVRSHQAYFEGRESERACREKVDSVVFLTQKWHCRSLLLDYSPIPQLLSRIKVVLICLNWWF